ncbi:uncharacterized protein B4U80_01252 [Leptotrombidium deliense]|uniref:Uncharacterized protein n=1 Tax=Leptotrombidium deliense TaxID=299467 RepID=A0A443SPW8_9ACAR|nr:uncharacterized protein B4U80_01252 [Leptotrombidium deliense]
MSNVSCVLNCSGHGECYNGICHCQVEYSGGACDNPNLRYYIAFSTVLCIKSEYARLKPRSITRAFRITIQKALYFFVFVATGLRGFYFSSPDKVAVRWADSLMSAYYPVILSSSSLIVCFWAELFHLHDVSAERPGFLSKSFTGFILFNVISYSLFLAELVLLQFSDASDISKSFFSSIFNSIYALLMLVVIVFFLIYGVEVYFKVRGAFIQGEACSADTSQLQQSRFGLVSQALLLSVTVIFIFSDVLGSFWKEKVPVISRNTHQIMFRVVELAVALWYPCAFWNCMRPEKLWILNPRRILKKEGSGVESCSIEDRESQSLFDDKQTITSDLSGSSRSVRECWICYDTERTDAGSLIQPCSCKGDVSVVHHECLKQWLIESSSNPETVKCKVCKEMYKVQKGEIWLPSGLTIGHWFQTAAVLCIMCIAIGGAYLMIRTFEHVYIRTVSVGCAILAEYICLRLLGFNMLSAYQRAKFSAVKIKGRKLEDFECESNLNPSLMYTVSDAIPGESVPSDCVKDLDGTSTVNREIQ